MIYGLTWAINAVLNFVYLAAQPLAYYLGYWAVGLQYDFTSLNWSFFVDVYGAFSLLGIPIVIIDQFLNVLALNRYWLTFFKTSDPDTSYVPEEGPAE